MAFSSGKIFGCSILGVAEILRKRRDLRSRMQIPPSQEERKISQNPVAVFSCTGSGFSYCCIFEVLSGFLHWKIWLELLGLLPRKISTELFSGSSNSLPREKGALTRRALLPKSISVRLFSQEFLVGALGRVLSAPSVRVSPSTVGRVIGKTDGTWFGAILETNRESQQYSGTALGRLRVRLVEWLGNPMGLDSEPFLKPIGRANSTRGHP